MMVRVGALGWVRRPPRAPNAKWLAAVVLFTTCSRQDTDVRLGGEWYVRSVPADTRRKLEAHRDLVRKWNGVSVIAATSIGPHYRYYESNCAMYEMPHGPQEDPFREVYLVCGDRWPSRVAFLSKGGALMDPDGLRPALGVEMRPNSTVFGVTAVLEPRPFIPIADMRAAAERQLKNTRGINPALRRANRAVGLALLFMFFGLALVMRWYRRMLR